MHRESGAAPQDRTATPATSPTAPPGLHRRLTINSISNLGSYLVSLGIAFALTPFIVRNLGDSLYGFWVLLTSFIGYASILEMGVQPAVVRLVGHYRARGDVDTLLELLHAAFVFFAAVGVLSALVFALVLPPLVPRFVEGLGSVAHLQLLFAVLAVDSIVMFMNYLSASVLYGHQLYYAKNLVDIAIWILNAGLLVTFLPRGGILALAACKLGTDVVTLVATAAICARTVPGFTRARRPLTRSSFRELLSFGSRIFVSATTTRLATYAQPVIISTALSSAATAFYSIPSRLVDYGRQVGWGLTTGFMPMFSELHSREQHELLRSIYLRYSRYIILATLPIPLLLFLFGRPFIHLWIGPEYAERGHVVLLLLCGSILVENFQPLLWRFFAGVGHLGVLVKVSAMASSLVILSGIALVKPLGIAGVAASVLIGSVLSQVVFTAHVCRFFGLGLAGLLAEVHLRPAIAGSVAFIAGWGTASVVGTATYPEIIVGAGAAVVAYVVLAWVLGLGRSEREWVGTRLGRMGRRSEEDRLSVNPTTQGPP